MGARIGSDTNISYLGNRASRMLHTSKQLQGGDQVHALRRAERTSRQAEKRLWLNQPGSEQPPQT